MSTTASINETNPILFTEFRDAMKESVKKELRRFIAGVAGEHVAEKVLAADMSALTEVLQGYAAATAVVANAQGVVPSIDMTEGNDRFLPTEPHCSRCGSTDVAIEVLSGSYNRMADMVLVNDFADKGHYCDSCVGDCRLVWEPVIDPTQAGVSEDDCEESAGAEA